MQANVAQELEKLSAELIEVSNELAAIQVKDPDLLALKAQGLLLANMLSQAEFSQGVVNQNQLNDFSNLVKEYRSIAADAISEFMQTIQ